MCNFGGIYLDFKTEGLRPLDPFLKYEIFFTDTRFDQKRFPPDQVGIPMMGAMQNNYYLKLLITEILAQDTINYDEKLFPRTAGAYVMRKAINDKELFTTLSFGFQLLSPRPFDPNPVRNCGFPKTLSPDQEVFEIEDKSGNKFTVGIPCR